MDQLLYLEERGRFGLPVTEVLDATGMVRRDALVSRMLQERDVVRILRAPHGFGKTFLAYEYATRLFAADAVWWVQATDPDFLRSLDDRAFGVGVDPVGTALVVLDDLPYLDEQRAQVLSDCIDMLLYRGVEVVITTLPSRDCISSLQPQRVLLRAPDLMVSHVECKPRAAMSTEEKAGLSRKWNQAGKRLFGRVPKVFWSRGKGSQDEVLADFFGEQLPRDLYADAFAMMLMGSGGLEELEHMGHGLHAENERLLMNDYPIFDIDSVQRSFTVQKFEFKALRDAICESGLSDELLSGTYPVAQRVLSALFARGDTKRAESVLEYFCTDEQCASWLRSWGWSLLDQGNVGLMESLFDRMPYGADSQDPVCVAMRAWTCGLLGNWHEAAHYARKALTLGQATQDKAAGFEARLAGKLALCAFDDSITRNEMEQEESYEDAPSKPLEFLARVLDCCTTTEVSRALCVDDVERSRRLEELRVDADPQRAERLRALFTEASARLHDDQFYQLALHLLSYVDNPQLKGLLQELGCDVIVKMRRYGVVGTTQALLVRDLWLSGYFGPIGRPIDKRDATLLETSSRRLKDMCLRAGYDRVNIPWEVASIVDNLAPSVFVRGATLRNQQDTPLLKVRLFGGFDVVLGDQPVRERRWRRKSRLLFTELVLRQGRDISRDEVLSLLWPSISRTRALDNYYNLWSALCNVVGGEPYIERTGDYCRINPRYVVSDVAEFEQLSRSLLMHQSDAQSLLDVYAHMEALYRGGLLPSETESEFVVKQRERYKDMFTDSMVAATAKALEQNNTSLALWFARKAMEVEQKREDVYFALISAQVAAGQRCSAIRTFFECKQFLRDEMGLDPSFETQELYNNLIALDPSLLQLTPSAFKQREKEAK